MKPPDIKALEAEIARLREINNRLRSDLYKANRRAEQAEREQAQRRGPAPETQKPR